VNPKAVMAVSVGPSGPNDVYLNNLNDFLQTCPSSSSISTEYIKQDDTCTLADMTHMLQTRSQLYFFYGSGSNQHGQIVPYYDDHKERQLELLGEDLPYLTESALCTPRQQQLAQDDNGTMDPPKQLYAGGGHSGLLTESGSMYLWGWNEHGQCGKTTESTNERIPLPMFPSVPDIQVEDAALGFGHTLLIEKETCQVYAMGDNSRGQVDPSNPSTTDIDTPITPAFLKGVKAVQVAAGLYHSAVLTESGELISFGCSKQGQSLQQHGTEDADSKKLYRTWKPDDGSRLIQVACGRHHTAVLDDQGRIWTFGDNKYGQLGRKIAAADDDSSSSSTEIDATKKKKTATSDPVPRQVLGIAGRCVQLECGWSHTVAKVQSSTYETKNKMLLYGWGRSDKGQLACSDKQVPTPRVLLDEEDMDGITLISCGSESSYAWNALKQTMLSCGWNEHGNLSLGSKNDKDENVYEFTHVVETRKVVSPMTYSKDRNLLLAAGGAHVLVMMT
jgi:alpha-tubulin suppressor-like RCC1 family protein